MNLVAMTDRARTAGSCGQQRPMIRSLSPFAVDLGRVEEGDPGVDAASQASWMVASVRAES